MLVKEEAKLLAEDRIRILESQLKSAHDTIQNLTSFQERNQYPVLKISGDGIILYANIPALSILKEWDCSVNQKAPASFFHQYPHILGNAGFQIPHNGSQIPHSNFDGAHYSYYIKAEFKFFSVGFMVVPVKELGYINLYGQEIDYSKRNQHHEREKLYRSLIEKSEAILCRWRADENFAIDFISGNISQFGYHAEDFLSGNLSLIDIIHPSDKDKLQDFCNTSLFECRINTKEGKTKWVEIRRTVMESNGIGHPDTDLKSDIRDLKSRSTYHLGVLIDITERKKAESAVKSTHADLKKMNFELDRFVYSASHDLRAPLRSLRGLIDLAKREDKITNLKSYHEKMLKSIYKLESFIDDLINFSRNSSSEIEKSKIDFEEIIQDTFENLKFMENAGNLRIETNISEVPFYSDSNRLSIIFTNMISNAIKYQNPDKSIKPHLKITIKVTTTDARIEFKDNGEGILKEHLGKIFNMFYRASNQTYGSGLGLYIVKEIIRKLKGNITVNSIHGEGSSFVVTLPNSKQ